MPREATIIGITQDYKGDDYEVREARPTDYGFNVLFGWPEAIPRGRGGQKVILTKELADFLASTKFHPGKHTLPIGNTTLKRLRRELGLNWHKDWDKWWQDNPTGSPEIKHSTKSVRRKMMGLPSKNWTAEEDQQLLALRAEGKTQKKCGEIMGRPENGIRCRLRFLRNQAAMP